MILRAESRIFSALSTSALRYIQEKAKGDGADET